MRDAGPAALYTSHGPLVRDGRALIDEYIAHREARVGQVRGALAAAAA
eukprot:gene2440-19129_t